MKEQIISLRELPCVTRKTAKSFYSKIFLLSLSLIFFSRVYSQNAVTVYSATFDNANISQPFGPNYNKGFFKSAKLVSVSGRGQVLQFDFKAGERGSQHGIGNYKVFLDSAYRELYLSWEYFIPSFFDYGFGDGTGGGKFFGGFSGGSVTKIPNNDATDNDGWLSMFMFQNGYYATYNYFKSSTFTKDGWPYGQKVANLVKGKWGRITLRAKINDGDQANGIFEVFDNDVLVYQLANVKFVNSAHPEYLIDAIDLNNFFGGSSAQHVSPINQYMQFDNLVTFYYPPSSPNYRKGASESGRKIAVPAVAENCPKTPNHFKQVNLTDSKGTIDSHCGFYYPVGNTGFQTATINATGATSLTINVTKFSPDRGSTTSTNMQILRIYSGTGSGKQLIRTYNKDNLTLAKHTINGSSATIEWQAGYGFTNGFCLSYTSNGTSSGKDIYCNHKHTALQMGGGTIVQPQPLPLSVPANLVVVSTTTSSVSLGWTLASGRQTSLELQRLSSTGSVLKTIQIDKAATKYTDTDLTANTAYQYKIRSSDGSTFSTFSNIIKVTTPNIVSEIPSPQAPGYLASWPFDEGSGTITKDVSGNNRNASLVGGTAYSTDKRTGSYSLKFDGVNDYVNAGAINLGNEFSISMWAKITSSDSKIRTLIANGNSGATQNGLRIGINTYGTNDRAINVMTGNGATYNDAKSKTGVFELNKWNNITICINRTAGKARIYYNGNDVTVDSIILNNFNNTNTLNIGRMLNGNFMFAGNMDDVRIFNRTLSKKEVMDLVNGFTNPPLNAKDDLNDSSQNTSSIIQPEVNNNFFTIFPNPSDGVINLRITDESVEGLVRVSVMDVTGKVIMEKRDEIYGNSQSVLDLTSQPSGVYFMTVESNKGQHSKKFILK